MRHILIALFCAVSLLSLVRAGEDGERKLRIIVFGAHPDDCELKAGGTAAKWAAQGHHVKMVSVTNGDIGHWQIKGEELAKRRLAENKAADKILGVETHVLPIHDGELEPTLENRRTLTRLIREWQADIVIGHRPWDYHPDHRYVGVLMQDAAYMVTVPFFCPETPVLKNNPVFMYMSDGFKKPYPFRADVVVSLDDVFEKKLDALHELESQFYEGGANGSANWVKSVPPADAPDRRKAWLRKSRWGSGSLLVAERFRSDLEKWYGEEKGKAVKYAEAFEICEYGSQPLPDQLRKLFPFYDAVKVKNETAKLKKRGVDELDIDK